MAAAPSEIKAQVATLDNYIGGVFGPPANGEYFDDLNPATSEVIAKIPRSGSVDVDNAVAAASKAFPAWSALSHEVRASTLDRIANAIEARLDEFAQAESRDTGKPVSLARSVDIPRAIANFRFFAGAIRQDFTEAHRMADAINYTLRAPVGVAGLITPWNLPLYLLTWKVAPALAVGNTVVAKPSELTPLTASLLANVIHSCDVPPGVFNLVHGFGAVAGQAIVAHPRVGLVSFTGGTATGQRVAVTAAPMFKKVGLELGGKNASVVFDDADFDEAVATAVRSSFANQGQICLCSSRLFVQAGIYDRFIAALAEAAKKLVVGDPSQAGVTFGSLVSLDHRKKVASYVELARSSGADIVIGGSVPENLPAPFDSGAFFLPTIIAGLPAEHACSQEEIFGPVVTVHKFETEEEVMSKVNAVRYGLAGSLWTSNLKRAHRLVAEWQTGMVWVNCWMHRDLRVPFGGMKDSGVGTEGGRHSLEFYTETRNVCIKL